MAYEAGQSVATVAVDQIGGKDYQAVKIDIGADGAASGPVCTANPMPVTVVTAAVLPTGAATATNQAAEQVLQGGVTETAPASDTASSGLNGRLQRIAQRLTSLIALYPTALGTGGGFKVDIVSGAGSGGTAATDEATFTPATTSYTPIGGIYNSTPDTLATGKGGAFQMTAARGQHVYLVDAAGAGLSLATAANQTSDQTLTGGVTETAPASDTASSGLNGRLQRVAQRVTSLMALWYTQGSTTSGQSGVLTQAAVTTTAPTYTNAQTSPLSMTTTGGLRTYDITGDAVLTNLIQSVVDISTAGASGDTSIVSAAGSGIRNYITDMEVVNTAGTVTRVDLYSGDPDSAGVLIASVPVGVAGVVKTFSTPRKGATNTAIFAQSTGSGACTVSLGGFTSATG